MSDEIENKIDRLFGRMPTNARAFIFNHDKGCGINIQWMEQGTGFGELTFVIDKETGEVRGDLEGMSPEWCGKMLLRLVGTVVQDIAQQEPVMIDDPEVVAHVEELTKKIKRTN